MKVTSIREVALTLEELEDMIVKSIEPDIVLSGMEAKVNFTYESEDYDGAGVPRQFVSGATVVFKKRVS